MGLPHMLTISTQGSIAAVLADLRHVPQRVVPYAASTALTRTAQAAQRRIVAELPAVFDRPTRYTLGATRVVPATVKTLAARVAVKDQASRGGTLPQDYLLPSVLGGGRREKRFERALRYAGVLQAGQRAHIGRDTAPDAAGNLSRAQINRVLAAAKAASGQKHAQGARRRAVPLGGKGAPYFLMRRRGGEPLGVFMRSGRTVTSVLYFSRALPTYRKRLDFEGLAERAAQDHFEPAFRRALADMLARRPR